MLKSPQKSSAKTVKSIKASRGRLADGQPNPVDVHVGMRLLLRRKQLNYSQGRGAGMLGLTFQQIQKYERGATRIGASRLWDFSRILRVPVEYFFQGMDEDAINHSPLMNFHTVEEVQKMAGSFFPAVDPMLSNENIRLINAVDNPKIAVTGRRRKRLPAGKRNADKVRPKAQRRFAAVHNGGGKDGTPRRKTPAGRKQRFLPTVSVRRRFKALLGAVRFLAPVIVCGATIGFVFKTDKTG